MDIFVFNLKYRHSGVSATIDNLLIPLADQVPLAYVCHRRLRAKNTTAINYKPMSLWQAIRQSRHRPSNKQVRIWHLRRNKEMLIGIICRDVLRLPIRLVFTSAAIRRHSAYPRWLIAQMDEVIATTEQAAKWINNCQRVIPHGVDPQKFKPPLKIDDNSTGDELLLAKKKAWQALGFSGQYGIGIYGRVRAEKGVHLFVDAMIKLLPQHLNFTAFIAGLCKKSDRQFEVDLKAKIALAGLSDRIVFLGEVSPKNIPSLYSASLITVACPLYEGFGLTILEGMASATACVASRTGAFSQLLSPDCGYLVDVGNSNALGSTLDVLLSNPRKAAMMALAGPQQVRAHYTIVQEAQLYLKTYRAVCQSHPSF